MKENLMKKVKKKKGFTLIELIIVIAIISILVGLAIPKLMGVQQDSKIRTDEANAKTIANAVATLITQDKIVPKDDGTTLTIDLGATTPTTEQTNVINYLQNTPIPKAVSKQNFIIEVAKEKANTSTNSTSNAQDARITVKVNSLEVYPNPDAKYGK